MTRKYLALALVGAACLALAPAGATTMSPEQFTCPVGGESFTGNVIGSYTSFGQRPDGRSYGTLPIFPIVECPGNGFLLFDEEFTPAEIAMLEQAVASAEYQAMRRSETPHYRTWWLARKIGREPQQLISSLLQATWESDDDWDRKSRYQAAFIAAATGWARTDENARMWFWYNLRAANALRELGHFDQARLLLDRVDRPDRLPADPTQLDAARTLIAGLRSLVAEQNAVPEPANLVPDRIAAYRCVAHRVPLTASEDAACDSERVRQAVAEYEVWDEDGDRLTGEAAINFIYAQDRERTPSA